MLYLVIFVCGLLVGLGLAALFLRGRDVGELCITKDNGKDLYYMAINEEDRLRISNLHRVSFHVRHVS